MLRSNAVQVRAFRVLLFVFCLGNSHAAIGQEGRSEQLAKLDEDLEQVLWWLPDETESIVVSRGNVPTRKLLAMPQTLQARAIPKGDPPPEHKYQPEKQDYQELVAESCIGLLAYYWPLFPDGEQDKLINAHFAAKTANLFVKAVWWRNDAKKEIVEIVVFRDETAGRLLASLAAFPHIRKDTDGVGVLEVDLTHKEPGYPANRRWLASPQRNVFVTTTCPELMKLLIERMKQRGGHRAFPPEIPEWQHVDLSAPAWGIRHFRPGVNDRLSMLRWDRNAKGLVFFGRNGPASSLVLRYVSASHDAGNRILQMQLESLSIFPIH
jgi:hypothetical protein